MINAEIKCKKSLSPVFRKCNLNREWTLASGCVDLFQLRNSKDFSNFKTSKFPRLQDFEINQGIWPQYFENLIKGIETLRFGKSPDLYKKRRLKEWIVIDRVSLSFAKVTSPKLKLAYLLVYWFEWTFALPMSKLTTIVTLSLAMFVKMLVSALKILCESFNTSVAPSHEVRRESSSHTSYGSLDIWTY